MNQHATEQTVGQLVVERSDRARVFEKLGLDYCCGGKKLLREACAHKGLDVEAVLRDLATSDATPRAEGEQDWTQASLSELVDHIVETHHAYLRQELPRLEFLVNKVAKVHGNRHPEMQTVRDRFEEFKTELEQHIVKEEAVLFPLCKHIETQRTRPRFHCGDSIQHPIHVMEQEHQDAGDALADMRTLTNGFTPPEDACNKFRVLLDGLAQLEADMHRHVHKENNILFPRAIALEQTLPPASPREALEIAVEPADVSCRARS